MIEIKKVSKRFDKIEAVSDVSLSIEEGQVFRWISKKEKCSGWLEVMAQERVHFFE